jgi:uroporphyrin-3 C-methyltransferase
VRPLLAGQQLNQLRLALSLTIEQAQWAALNGDAKVYTGAGRCAQRAAGQLQRRQPAKQSHARQPQCAGRAAGVGGDPDLSESLAAVQAYIQRRHAGRG